MGRVKGEGEAGSPLSREPDKVDLPKKKKKVIRSFKFSHNRWETEY